jgi:hypothetical protein
MGTARHLRCYCLPALAASARYTNLLRHTNATGVHPCVLVMGMMKSGAARHGLWDQRIDISATLRIDRPRLQLSVRYWHTCGVLVAYNWF